MKKNPPVKNASNFSAFVKDLQKLDKKILLPFGVLLFLSLFVSQRAVEQGSVFGIQTGFFETETIYKEPLDVSKPALYPKKITQVAAPYVSAEAAIVIDADSQVVLFEKNQDVRFPPASTTKIMTALVGMEYFAFNDVLEASESVNAKGSKMGLKEGEKMTFENMLFGLLLNSGNDAAETIARESPQGLDGFIARMNEKASELHLENTHFEDVTGLASENHYTTALDLARLASYALKESEFAKIVGTKAKVVSDISGSYIHELENVNKLLGVVEGVDGVKTGYTQEAGQVLVAAATRNTHTIITVVLRSEDRFLDSRNLLEWAFSNFSFTEATAL